MNANKLMQDIKQVADLYQCEFSIHNGDIMLKYPVLGYGSSIMERIGQVLRKNGVPDSNMSMSPSLRIVIVTIYENAMPIDFEKLGIHYG